MKKILLVLLAILTAAFLYFSINILPMMKVASAYSAKCLCTNTFYTEREINDIERIDLSFLPVRIKNHVERKQQQVTSSVFGLAKKTAVAKDDLGCVLLQGKDDHHVRFRDSNTIKKQVSSYPYKSSKSNTKFSNIDTAKLNEALSFAFDENYELTAKKTRGVLILHQDTILAEQYAVGHDQDTKMIGWSMTKSLVNALTGMLIEDGVISLSQTNLFEEWATDERKDISVKHLLQMNSGLEWDENYDEVSDATSMLYLSEDVTSVPIISSLQHPIGSHWEYSSGTTNLLSRFLLQQFKDKESFYQYIHNRLFDAIGMDSAFIETDETGNIIGSSYAYATLRDWGRFGTLYLNNGNWNGKQLLSEEWINFTKQTAEGSSGEYGAHFWLNKGQKYYPDCPEDMYMASGFQGQKVIVIPSKKLVIVRLGFNSEFDFNQFISLAVASTEYSMNDANKTKQQL